MKIDSPNESAGETENKPKGRKYRACLLGIFKSLGVGLIGAVVVYLIVFPGSPLHRKLFQRGCAPNLKALQKALQVYTYDFVGVGYPTPGKWCDLLMENYGSGKEPLVDEKVFVCKHALAKGNKGRCHYAINPNCKPNSPGGTVLLFETKGGWNQYGGPEIMALENHKKRGCYILFNDGHVEFVEAEGIGELKW